ncbi:AMP-binding protein [Sporosarcina sp. FSL W7-1349]|uniref:AMP-binding protein n=1 Tax=Sporosarcina sp. FSL W7-1349 TaxID=2921561 RepID=UPI0030F78B92
MKIDVHSLYGRRNVNRWERMSVGDMLERITYSFPDKEAFVAWEGAYAHPSNKRITYLEADRKANQFANALLEKGLQRGDRILLLCDNSVEAFLTKIAIAKAGLVAVPVNTMMAPDVISYLITYVEPEMLIIDAEHWENVGSIFEEHQLMPAVTIPIGGEVIAGSQSFEAFIEGKSTEAPEVEIHGDDIWEMLFTSGTTSMPKCVMISHTYTYMAAYSFALSLTRGVLNESQVKLCGFLPVIYHIADVAFVFSVFLSGGTFIIGRKLDKKRIAEAISEEKVTALYGGSTTFLKEFTDYLYENRNKYDATSLKVILYAWASFSPEYAERLQKLCGDSLSFFEMLGQTESIASFRFWHDLWPETYKDNAPAVNYVGVPAPILSAALIDANGQQIQEARVPGEAVYRSPAMMSGYYKDEEATKEAFKTGWFHSGDSCIYDENGLAIMLDRFKDVIKTGGENVSSLRVEAVIGQHPAVERAAVIGVPDEKWNERVVGIVVLKEQKEASEEEILTYCRKKLAGYETPKEIIFVKKLPSTVGGKILKHQLRKQFAETIVKG